MSLHPDVAPGVHLSAICSRNRYTTDPDPVIAELRATAGDRDDILAAEVGRWVGFYGDDLGVDVLVTTLRRLVAGMPGADTAVAVGRRRRGAPPHGTASFGDTPPPGVPSTRNDESPPPRP